jgi:hypothetical protein
MELTANHPDLEQRLRLQVLEAWNGFEQASRQSRDLPLISADAAPAERRDFDSFFRYQRALNRYNDLVVFGRIPEGPD